MFAEKSIAQFNIGQLFSNFKNCFAKPNKNLSFFYDDVGNRSIQTFHYDGKKMVSLSKIIGSMNASRCRDFDAKFKLQGDHGKERLAGVEAASRKKALPSISLMQLGDSFYIQDGHHRVSIALAKGQDEILAKVTAVSLEQTVSPANLSFVAIQ